MPSWRAVKKCSASHRRHIAASAASIRGAPTAHSPTEPGLRPLNIARLLALPSDSTTDSHRTVKVNGFVRSVRKQKHIAFAAIGDGSSFAPLQVVLTPGQAEDLSTGASVSITGEWRECLPGKLQSHELHARDIAILGENDATTSPIQKKYQSSEFLRTLPHLRTRLPFNSLLLRLRSDTIQHISHFFVTHGFIQTHPPVITSSDCEGAGEVFALSANPALDSEGGGKTDLPGGVSHFFRSRKYLTVSSQLHLEALAQSVGRVWTLSPAFRAEKSDTPRHLSEFYMLEAEMCFVEDLGQIMGLLESLIKYLVLKLQRSAVHVELQQALSRNNDAGEAMDSVIPADVLGKRWAGLTSDVWPRITYKEALALLDDAGSRGKATFDSKPSTGSGLRAEHERYLAEHVGEGSPVFVTCYPRGLKPFYMASRPTDARDGANEEEASVSCFDLIVPDICELAGGSMREHKLADLLDNMRSHGLTETGNEDHRTPYHAAALTASALSGKSASLQWYVDLRRYGSVPHGGFGLGFDRLLAYLSGVCNLRDIVAFPRSYGRCDC